MIIECPNCSAQYDIGPATSLAGRKTRCSQCSHVWQPIPGDASTDSSKLIKQSKSSSDIPSSSESDDAPFGEKAPDQDTGRIAAEKDSNAVPGRNHPYHQVAQPKAGGQSNEIDSATSQSTIISEDGGKAKAVPVMPSRNEGGALADDGEPGEDETGRCDDVMPGPGEPGDKSSVDSLVSKPMSERGEEPQAGNSSSKLGGRHAQAIERRLLQKSEQEDVYGPLLDDPSNSASFSTPLPEGRYGGADQAMTGMRQENRQVRPSEEFKQLRPGQFNDPRFNTRRQSSDFYHADHLAPGAGSHKAAPSSPFPHDSEGPIRSSSEQTGQTQGMDQSRLKAPSKSWFRKVIVALGWLFLLGGIAALGAASWLNPNEFVRLFPGTAGIYAAAGKHINIRGLDFVRVRYKWIDERGQPKLVVGGVIKNVTNQARPVPSLVFVLFDTEDREIYKWAAEIRNTPLPGGKSTRFAERVPAPPKLVRRLEVRFARE